MAAEEAVSRCELRCQNERWSLVLPLASMEEAAAALARLGKSEATTVAVQIFSDADGVFVERGTFEIAPPATDRSFAARLREVARQGPHFDLRGIFSSQKYYLAAFVVALVAMGVHLWPSERPQTVPSSTPEPIASVDRPAIYRPVKNAVDTQNKKPQTDAPSSGPLAKIMNRRWSLNCYKQQQVQFTPHHQMDVIDGKQFILRRASYEEVGDRVNVRSDGAVETYTIDGISLELHTATAAGFRITAVEPKRFQLCPGPPVSLDESRLAGASQNPITVAITMALALKDEAALSEIFKSKPKLTESEKASLKGVSSAMPASIARMIEKFLGIETVDVNDYTWPNTPWERIPALPTLLTGAYGSHCEMAQVHLRYNQIVMAWRGDPPKVMNFEEVHMSKYRFLIKFKDGMRWVLQSDPSSGIRVVASILSNGTALPNNNESWMGRCSAN